MNNLRRYRGYISAIKNGESNSRVHSVKSDNPLTVVKQLQDYCKQAYPESEGWHSHATSQADEIVVD